MNFEEIRVLLLSIGGNSVRPVKSSEMLDFIVSPTLDQRSVVLGSNPHGNCHRNVISLHNSGFLARMATGFALAPDGDWCRHSWGLIDTQIVETNGQFVKYWGNELTQEQIPRFQKILLKVYGENA